MDGRVVDGDEFGSLAEPGSPEEYDFIGIPGILEPEQVSELLKQRHTRQARRQATRVLEPDAEPETGPLYRTLGEQRRLLNSLVGMRAKIAGQPHGLVHAELRRECGGPAVAQATVTQLQARIDLLRKMARG